MLREGFEGQVLLFDRSRGARLCGVCLRTPRSGVSGLSGRCRIAAIGRSRGVAAVPR